jgi:hypothetical protein
VAALAGAALVSPPARGQAPAVPIAQCRAELPAAAAARLRLCEAHNGCRAVARVIDSCPGLQTFLELLAANGSQVDDAVLRRALIEAGVPPSGLPSCTSEFNRALCRNFLNLEDASGETAAGPSRKAQFELALRQLVEQQERARVPADAHRLAESRLEACAAARPGADRDVPCREAIEAVRACETARQQWQQRREVLLVDAYRLGLATAQPTLRALDMPPCPNLLPGSTLTPQQALTAAVADVPDSAADSLAGPGAAPVLGRERERERERERATAPAPPLAAAPTAAAGGAGTAAPRSDNGSPDCKTALRRMEERFEQIQRRRPAQADRLAAQQVEIFMLTEQMGVLERLCRNQREYDFLRPTQDRLARALQECRAGAANPVNDCVPRVAW